MLPKVSQNVPLSFAYRVADFGIWTKYVANLRMGTMFEDQNKKSERSCR